MSRDRRKYDAAKTLAAFGARLRLRDNVELTTLRDDLLASGSGLSSPIAQFRSAASMSCGTNRHRQPSDK